MLHSNPYIDGILWGGNNYGNTITYSFWSDASLDDNYDDIDTVDTPWFDSEKAAMQQALTTWSNVANINFVETADNNPNATLKFTLVNSSEFDALGAFNPPGEFGEGIGYFNWEGRGWDEAGLQQGGDGFITLIHELGHGLGLAHPHDTGGGSSIYPGVDSSRDTGNYGLNQGVWTTMTYNQGLDTNDYTGILNYGYQGTPMAFDIAAIQYLYGANMSYKTGNDTYLLPTSNTSGTFYSCLWDAGGSDTISASTATANATINLKDAPLVGPNAGGYISSVQGIYGGFTIANGVVIENAIGGSGDDTLFGNEANNNLSGGSGNDYIDGWTGDDTLYGDAGDDTLLGYDGNDSLDGGTGNDSLNGEAGNDYLNGWTGDDTLYGDVGDDTLLGYDGNDSLDGGAGNDSLKGEAGNDTLLGGTGTDTLVGGSGNDSINSYGGITGEYDILTGDSSSSLADVQDTSDGADTFILGDAFGAYYLGTGYAIITDFYWDEGDKFQVYGSESIYSLGVENLFGTSAADTLIYYQSDLIAVVQDTTDVVIPWDFTFV
ncbi:MAG: M10 family metallopeptidase [Cyanobacteriota bacterium]